MSLKEKWDKEAPGFFDWFSENKIMTVESCMLKPVREFAGLGSPPDPFYTNDVESANRIIKITRHLNGLNFANWLKN